MDEVVRVAPPGNLPMSGDTALQLYQGKDRTSPWSALGLLRFLQGFHMCFQRAGVLALGSEFGLQLLNQAFQT